jgi:hypothetical protein
MHVHLRYRCDGELVEGQALDLGVVQELFEPGDHQLLQPVRGQVDLHRAVRRITTARCSEAREHAGRGAGEAPGQRWRADLDASVRGVLKEGHANRRSASEDPGTRHRAHRRLLIPGRVWTDDASAMSVLVLTTVGVGAADSPRFAPAALLVVRDGMRVMLDGGPGAEPSGRLDAWLVTDDHAELMAQIRRLARARGLEPRMGDFTSDHLHLEFHPVVHTNHLTGGYLIRAAGWKIAWAPEFLEFPTWAAGANLMFAEASAWNRPIRFARGAGGHLNALAVAEAAHAHGVGRLVFAHIGRPAIKAIDRGEKAPFGEFGHDRQVFRLRERR